MSFSDLRPSTSWAALKYKRATIAEVWFKPADEPWGLILRIRHENFQMPELAQALSVGQLLSAMAIALEDVETWRLEGMADPNAAGPAHDLATPLPPPAVDSRYLLVHVRLKPAEPGSPVDERADLQRRQDLETRWRVLVGLESGVESLRLRMDAIRAEMEATAKRPLTTEEKLNALQADVVQLARVKNRVHYTLPKAKEFIHRATWMLGAPERKLLEETYTKYVESPDANPEPQQIESMIKDRQIFTTQGEAVYQECRGVIANIQAALRTLQNNALANVKKKRPFGKTL